MKLKSILCMVVAQALLPLSLQAAEKPNILVFFVDDMGVMDTSVPFLTDAEGKPVRHPLNDFYHTPGMEKLASQGLSFSQFYANSVCSPSRASLMTGQSSARHKTTQWIKVNQRNGDKKPPPNWNWEGLNKKSLTLARLLQSDGYRTIHCGKGHFGPDNHEGAEPLNLGFDVNIAGRSIGVPGSYLGTKSFGHAVGNRRHVAVPGLEKYHGKDVHLTDVLTIEMNQAISKAVEEKKPFYAYMSHYAVHGPFESDKRFAERYKDVGKPGLGRNFATMVEGVDKSLTDIIDHLETLGVAENTLVLFLGDNGTDSPSASRPLKGKKATCFEGGMRVPFIASWAKPSEEAAIQKKFPIKPRLIHDEFGNIADVFPTLLNVAGVDLPDGHVVDGNDLWGYFNGENKVNPQTFLMHFPHEHRSDYFTVYREKDWKLIYFYFATADKRMMLFNLKDDPFEKNNLAAEKPEVLKAMVTAMQQELDEADAQYPVDPETKKEVKVEHP